MSKINLFCFGFGQVAKEFIKKLLANNIKINLITTSRNKTGEYDYCNFKFKNFNFNEKNFDKNLIQELKKINYILISTPPINKKDLFLDLLNSNSEILARAKWITYLSSTSVYGDHNGEWVDENSRLVPNTEKGKIRLEIESKNYPIQIFRLAGIYSKENNLISKIKANKSKIIKKDNHMFSRIHLEDISGFLLNSFENFKSGEIYNIADDQPLSNKEIVYEIVKKYNFKLPPIINYKNLQNSNLKDFYSSSKKVKNNKAKLFFNYKLVYPTLREGLNLL